MMPGRVPRLTSGKANAVPAPLSQRRDGRAPARGQAAEISLFFRLSTAAVAGGVAGPAAIDSHRWGAFGPGGRLIAAQRVMQERAAGWSGGREVAGEKWPQVKWPQVKWPQVFNLR